MAKICEFRSATTCGFIEKNLSPCPACPFKKEQEAKVASIQGKAGSPGPVGPQGPEGRQGIPGQPGDRGPLGPIGATGLTGVLGDQGPRGFAGPKGDKGNKGEKGDEGTVDEELLKKLIAQFGGQAQPQLLLGWGARSHADTSHTDSGEHLLRDGSVPLTADWIAGAFKVRIGSNDAPVETLDVTGSFRATESSEIEGNLKVGSPGSAASTLDIRGPITNTDYCVVTYSELSYSAIPVAFRAQGTAKLSANNASVFLLQIANVVDTDGFDITNALAGLVFAPLLQSSQAGSTIAAFYGINVGPILSLSNNPAITTVTSVRAIPSIILGSGTLITDLRQFHANFAGTARANRVTQFEGDTLTAGTDLHQFKMGNNPSWHEGDLRIGSAVDPTVALDVTGAALISTTLGVTDDLTVSGGDVLLKNATANRLSFRNVGVEAPGASSDGMKIQFFPRGTQGVMDSRDYAMGVENDTLWLNTARDFKWYMNSSLHLTFNGVTDVLTWENLTLLDRIRLYNGSGVSKWGFGIADWRFVMYMDGDYTGDGENPGRFSWRQAVDSTNASTGTPVFEIDTQGSIYSFLQRDQIGAVYKAYSTQTQDMAQWTDNSDVVTMSISGSGGIDTRSSFGAAVAAISSATTLAETHHFVACDASGGAFTVTLPAASGATRRIYHIKKTDSSGNTVTVDGNSSETIDGDTTKVIATQYDSMMIVCDGSNWHIV